MSDAGSETIFVAGASGVIGQPLCRLLVEDGWTVAGTTRSAEKAAMLRALGVEPAIVDVFDEGRLLDAVCRARPAVVIHQLTDLPAGLDPAKMAEARIRNARLREVGTRNLVAAAVAAGAKRLVTQSIAFAYARGPQPYGEDARLDLDDPELGATARAAASLEQQVLDAPLDGIVLRYGKLYGPGTGFDAPGAVCPLHVDAAADAARRAVTRGGPGVYNVAEDDGMVCCDKAARLLDWKADFRLGGRRG